FHLCRRPDLVRASSRCICISRRPPASTPFPYTTLFRSQAYEALLLRLRASRLTEAHDAADAILEELRKVIPAFLTRVDVADRGVDRKSTRLNSSHVKISYAVFCLKKKT